ncbi:MAG TPA: hypothetical protein VFJ74_10715 [Gemmatimonadaceae bacterium]|nr:hypothetical protein [Gemmatimonadaceae bacterium]
MLPLLCACGCGEPTEGGVFRPGHDQKLRTALERRVGGLLALRELVAAAEAHAHGRLPAEALGLKVKALVLGRSLRLGDG